MLEATVNLVLNLDQNLIFVAQTYGMWTYLILFFIIFFETGFVITPFLPGDSLLFVYGAAAASWILDLQLLIVAFIFGAIIGDTVNYWIGNYVGLHVFLEGFPNFVKKKNIVRPFGFYEK